MLEQRNNIACCYVANKLLQCALNLVEFSVTDELGLAKPRFEPHAEKNHGSCRVRFISSYHIILYSVHRVSKNCANLFFVRTLSNFDRL